jgi:NADPH:quinone reductase
MKAAWYEKQGTPDVLVVGDMADPAPGPGEVRIRVGLGIPALTAHRAVHAGGPVAGRQVLVQGGAGGVGSFAVGLARRAGAQVIATVRSKQDEDAARRAGAHEAVRTDLLAPADAVALVRKLAPGGVHHIVDVAFDADIDMDEQVLAPGGSISAYATGTARPAIPFWPLLFKNARILLLGSDDFAIEAKLAAAQETNALLADGWQGIRIDRRFALDDIAAAHRYAQAGARGRVVLEV